MTVLQTGPCSRTGSGGQVEARGLHFLWGSWVGTEARGLQGRDGPCLQPQQVGGEGEPAAGAWEGGGAQNGGDRGQNCGGTGVGCVEDSGDWLRGLVGWEGPPW